MSQTKSSALGAAVALLARRDYSERELRDKLSRRGYLNDEVDEAVLRLQQRGYLNDSLYCRKVADSLWQSGKWGIRGVVQQLRQRGLPDSEIRESVELFTYEQELEYALRLLNRKRVEPQERDKAGRYLAARGFSYSVIERALEDFVCEQ